MHRRAADETRCAVRGFTPQDVPHNTAGPGRGTPGGPGAAAVHRDPTECAVGGRLHLRRDVHRLRLRRLRRRRVQPHDRRLAGGVHDAHRAAAGRTRHAAVAPRRLGQPVDGLVHHSDAGSQYTSMRWTERRSTPAPDPRSARSATPTTTRSRRASSAPTRPSSSGTKGRGAAWTTSSSPPSPGSTGTTTPACTRPWTTGLPPRSKPSTTVRSTSPCSRSRENPPGTEPGAVQPFIWKATAEDIITKVQRGRAVLTRQTNSTTGHESMGAREGRPAPPGKAQRMRRSCRQTGSVL